MKIEALIISVDEPQLDRCVVSVQEQTVPFSDIIHINGIVPESAAFDRGMSLTTEEWVMGIGGDFILYKDAVETAIKYMEQNRNDKIFGYFFGLHDTFLECDIGFCEVLRTLAYKSIIYPNKLSSDRKSNRALRKKGWISEKVPNILIGTHFDRPDEFQVFRRFYLQSIKYADNSFVRTRMAELMERTGNQIYSIGIKAIDFAKFKKMYPGSHNLDFDRKMFEEFNENNGH